jgi:diaminopimelate decarboxylase
LPRPQVGDLLALPLAGAYCFSMANNNGALRARVVLVRDGLAKEIVRRERLEDLLARHVPYFESHSDGNSSE